MNTAQHKNTPLMRGIPLYPIKSTQLKPLWAWKIEVEASRPKELTQEMIIRQLVTSVNKENKLEAFVRGFASELILTDSPDLSKPLLEEQAKLLNTKIREQGGRICAICPDPNYQPSVQEQAAFVASAITYQYRKELRSLISAKNAPPRLGKYPCQVRYPAKIKSYVVAGEPCLAILTTAQCVLCTLAQFLREENAQAWQGLTVVCPLNNHRGRVTNVLGSVDEHGLGNNRASLISDTTTKALKERYRDEEKVPGNDTVVSLEGYTYPSSVLRLTCHPSNWELLKKIGVSSQDVMSLYKRSPTERCEHDQKVRDFLVDKGYIEKKPASNKGKYSKHFGQVQAFACTFGGGKVNTDIQLTSFLRLLKKHGLYKVGKKDPNLGWLPLVGVDEQQSKDYLGKIQAELETWGFTPRFQPCSPCAPDDMLSFEKSLAARKAEGIDLLILLYPKDKKQGLEEFPARAAKLGIPTQGANEGNFHEPYQRSNVCLGILAKLGHITHQLTEPLPETDQLVGLDICRKQKERSKGTESQVASVALHSAHGIFTKSCSYEARTEGETISQEVLKQLFCRPEFEGKRVVIHRDGPFRGQEVADLQAIEKQCKATFHLVAVCKQGAPKIYAAEEIAGPKHNFCSAPPGTFFRLNEREAFLFVKKNRILTPN